MKNILKKAIILPLIVAVALAVVIIKVKSRSPIEHDEAQFPTKTVEVITLKKLPFRNRATAYGNVEPDVLLKAKTEVSGKISYIHPKLKKGASLAKGTVVLRIELTKFEFSREQSQAGLTGSQSSLQQLNIEEASTRRSLELATKNLETGEKELDRLSRLEEKDLIARSTVAKEQQKVLQLRQQVEDLQGRLASFDSRRSASEAQIKQSQTRLAESKDVLGRTEIQLPFDARIGNVSVENGEYVTVGSVLFEASGTQAIEINAQLPVRQFFPLIKGLEKGRVNLQNPADLQAEFSKFQLIANVSLAGQEYNQEKWRGELLRVGESIDPTRDTVSLVVAVNNPYVGVIPGQRPPLLKGMYAAVEFFGPAREALVVPRKAVHQGRVYVAVRDNDEESYRLEIRPVNIVHQQGQLVILDSGVTEGEQIVITDVIPVMEGLPLNPIVAADDESRLAKEALGDDTLGDAQ